MIRQAVSHRASVEAQAADKADGERARVELERIIVGAIYAREQKEIRDAAAAKAEPALTNVAVDAKPAEPPLPQHDAHIIIYRLWQEADAAALAHCRCEGRPLPKKSTPASHNGGYGWAGNAGDVAATSGLNATQSFILAHGGMSGVMDRYSR